ncbi:PoNi-like cognate immunity protein [Cupriavidus sp. JZ107]
MKFVEQRRQPFLSESNYRMELEGLLASIDLFSIQPSGVGRNLQERWLASAETIASKYFELCLLKYTAGDDISALRSNLDQIVSAYEDLAQQNRNFHAEPDRPVFSFASLDDYCRLLQLIGLCYLLHRRDLLPRIAKLCDALKGEDAIYEDLLAFSLSDRVDVDQWFWDKPYGDLIKAFYKDIEAERIACLRTFLKRWYKDLSSTGWHDAHKPDSEGRTGGYFGYWSFEAGAAVLLLGIEDDTSLHPFLYYPKDIVAWAKANMELGNDLDASATGIRSGADQSC